MEILFEVALGAAIVRSVSACGYWEFLRLELWRAPVPAADGAAARSLAVYESVNFARNHRSRDGRVHKTGCNRLTDLDGTELNYAGPTAGVTETVG